MARQLIVGIALLVLAVTAAWADGPVNCMKQKDAALCDDFDDCVWCIGSKVATQGYCYPRTAAKLLPSKYFQCDKTPSSAKRSTTQPQARSWRDAACDKRTEDSCVAPDCVWCTSAAVGGGCYTPQEARMLPSAIFKCKTSPTASS